MLQISAGRTHSAAWTAPPPVQQVPGIHSNLQLGVPEEIPNQYTMLREISIPLIRDRLRILHHFSDLIYSSWRLFNLASIQVSVCVCVCACFCTSVCVYVHTHIHTHTVFCVCVCLRVCMCVCVSMFVCLCLHIYVCIHAQRWQ